MAITCAECGTKLGFYVKGAVCPKCEMKISDWNDFGTHEYSRDELTSIPLSLHLCLLARVGALSILAILLPSALGGLFGYAVGGDSGYGVGLLLGIYCGVTACKFTRRLPTRDRYETLFARRKRSFVGAAVIFGVIGALTGMVIPAAAGWTLGPAGIAGRAIPVFIGLALLGPIIGVAGAYVFTLT